MLHASNQQTTTESIWLTIFKDQPEVQVHRFSTLFTEGDRALFVYVMTGGAVIELKGDQSHDGHLVSLCKRGDVFGIRVNSTVDATHTVRAMALTIATLRVMSRERFMQLVMQSPDLFIALSVCLSKRQHFTQTLQDSCNGSSLRAHVEYILSAVATEYGMDHDHAAVAVPESVLMEMVGCPQPLLETYLQRLVVDGIISVDVEGVRLRAV